MANESTAQEITVTRAQLAPAGGGGYRSAWRWTYSYSVDGAPALEYGTGLASLRSMVRKFFPGARIVEQW